MLLKMGVDISRLCRELRRKLTVIDNVVARNTGKEAVVTSTYEGFHSPASLHYCNQAIDIRTVGSSFGTIKTVASDLRDHLGRHFDIVVEKDHIHIEYDPKGV